MRLIPIVILVGLSTALALPSAVVRIAGVGSVLAIAASALIAAIGNGWQRRFYGGFCVGSFAYWVVAASKPQLPTDTLTFAVLRLRSILYGPSTGIDFDELRIVVQVCTALWIGAIGGLLVLASVRLGHGRVAGSGTPAHAGSSATNEVMDANPWRIDAPTAIVLAIICLLGLGFRLTALSLPMRWDEARTALDFCGDKSIFYTISHYPEPNNHVLHSVLVSASIGILGVAEWSVRLPALIFGLAIIPTTFLVARQWFSPTSAMLSAAMTAASSQLVYYSANARGYTMIAELFLLSLLAASSILARPTSHRRWLALALLGALGAWTNPIMLYPFAVVFVVLVIRLLSDGESPWRVVFSNAAMCALTTGGLAILLYVPILVTEGPRAIVGNDFVLPIAITRWLYAFPKSVIATLEAWMLGWPAIVAAVLVVAAVIDLVFAPETARRGAQLGWVAIAICLLIPLMQRVVPFVRVWVWLLPLGILFSCAALSRCASWERRLQALTKTLIPIAVCLAAGLAARSTWMADRNGTGGAFPDARGVIGWLKPRLKAEDRVFYSRISNPQLRYYAWVEDVEIPDLHYGGGETHGDAVVKRKNGSDYVIVNSFYAESRLHRDTLDVVLENHGLVDRAADARLVKALPTARIYRIDNQSN